MRIQYEPATDTLVATLAPRSMVAVDAGGGVWARYDPRTKEIGRIDIFGWSRFRRGDWRPSVNAAYHDLVDRVVAEAARRGAA